MILLDTNVVSEVMKSAPAKTVTDWLNSQDAADLYLSVVTVAEITYGLRALPDGKRQQSLEATFEGLIADAFEGRVLAFDETAARLYGQLMSDRKRQGCPMSIADGIIAAIARAKAFALATRNVRDFDGCGLEVIDPFV
ncbi:MAG: type II toxin-antitoxin system VapC family toxin [Kiloniellales bacterium]|nr:type II toxin-antitoxin system VapC family toxin [Kiloniellales bacterium]